MKILISQVVVLLLLKNSLVSADSYIPLPKWISDKKAIVNVKNNDNECFKWAVTCSLNWKEIGRDAQRVSKVNKYVDKYDWSGLEFPVSLKDIDIFERNNEDISVNVLFSSGKEFYICRRSNYFERSEVVNLLLVVDGEKRHYTTIRDIGKLLNSSNSKNEHKRFYCMNCLNYFTIESILKKHT